jgi:hypothetical protein
MKDINLDTSDMDLSCFDDKQQEVVLQLVKQSAHAARDAVIQDTDSGYEFSDISKPAQRLYANDAKKVEKATQLWKNNGVVPGLSERITYDELVAHDLKYSQEFAKEAADAGFTSTDHPILINRVISEIVKEAIEPNIVLTSLLQRVNFSHGTSLTFPAMGAIAAADIPEGGEYPERSLDFAGQTVATIGKSGLAVKMTEEMIRYSLFDVMSMHLTAAGRALLRHKEQKVADLIIANASGANTLFDNTNSTTYLSTTGRDGGGEYNGTLTLDDLFTAYATMVNRGFMPDTLIMNPFAWEIFADEAIARTFGFMNGMQMWQTAQGNLGTASSFAGGGEMNLLNNTQVTDPQQLAGTFTNVPSIFPAPFNIIVSPYMPFTASTNRTDLILCNRSELGILVVDEEVTTDEWNDPARDIRKVKLRERYGLGTANNGSGTGIIKGISLSRGFDFSRSVALQLSSLLSPLSGDTGFSGEV